MSASLWRNHDFVKMWTGESVSLFGTYITQLAFPLPAILALDATASEVGFINAARFAPFLLIPLFAGVWVDRHRRKPLLLMARVGCAVALCAVPLTQTAGMLSVALMCVIAFVIGALGVVDQIAYQAFVPSVVPKDQLVQANSGFMGSESAASVAGPGVAGLLIAAITAPVALLANAASFVFSTVMLLFVGVKEQKPTPVDGDKRVFAQILLGMRLTLGNRVLVSLIGWSGTYNFFHSGAFTLVVIFLVHSLRFRCMLTPI